jgi:hypothetical protein
MAKRNNKEERPWAPPSPKNPAGEPVPLHPFKISIFLFFSRREKIKK